MRSLSAYSDVTPDSVLEARTTIELRGSGTIFTLEGEQVTVVRVYPAAIKVLSKDGWINILSGSTGLKAFSAVSIAAAKPNFAIVAKAPSPVSKTRQKKVTKQRLIKR